jgi:hypothetical protein
VVQDVEAGLAEQPQWGPHNGPAAVSEQALADRALDALPPGSVVIGDRNFGIFATAFACHLRQHPAIVRLTEKRAKALVGPIASSKTYAVQWRPSKFERRKTPDLPDNAVAPGRLIACRVGRGKHKQWLYLFTTWMVPDQTVITYYGKRWNVETDLKSLKQTLRLRRIHVRSTDMLDKELMVAVIGYNLVRAIMCLASQASGVPVRRLSFTRSYDIVHDCYAQILNAPSHAEQVQELEHVVALVSQCRLYPRSKHRSYPRRVWRTPSYPLQHPPEN